MVVFARKLVIVVARVFIGASLYIQAYIPALVLILSLVGNLTL